MSSDQPIRAIETVYKGYRFRSRLEARWAVCFDVLDLPWQYEIEGFSLPSGPYLPDFWLPDNAAWLEVKPGTPTEMERQRAGELAAYTDCKFVTILAGSPWVGENTVYAYTGLLPRRFDRYVELAMRDEQFGVIAAIAQFYKGYYWKDAIERLKSLASGDTEEDKAFLAWVDRQFADIGAEKPYSERTLTGFENAFDAALVAEAYAAARAARFEHGERG